MPQFSRNCLRFKVSRPFKIDVRNSARYPQQHLPAGESAYLCSLTLARQIAAAASKQPGLECTETNPSVSGLDALQHAKGRSVLFLMPTEAMGDTVCYAGAVREVARTFGLGRIGVAFSAYSSDVWAHTEMPVEVFPLILPESALARFDLVIDFVSDIPELGRMADAPLSIDDTILRRLNIPTQYRWAKRPARKISRVAIFPISSNPLRIVPAALVTYIAAALSERNVTIDVVVDPRTRQGIHFQAATKDAAHVFRTVSNLNTVDAVARYIRDDIDYGIFCDSGPAHVTKLFDVPGFCLYTSVGSMVQGQFRNVAAWQSSYEHQWCRAPCGLTAVMKARARDAHGCMDTLQEPPNALVRSMDLPEAATGSLLEKPPGCVAALIRDREMIVDAIRTDLDRLDAAAALTP